MLSPDLGNKIWFTALFLLLVLAQSIATQAKPKYVTFPSTDLSTEVVLGKVKVSAKLYKPKGEGPFPAVVLLHGCGGPSARHDDQWASRFIKWGYVAILPNSLKFRKLRTTCRRRYLDKKRFVKKKVDKRITNVEPRKRIYDSADTVRFLQTLSFVDKDRIAVAGWSHGGQTAFLLADTDTSEHALRDLENTIQGIISFYGTCKLSAPPSFFAPLLVLVGAKDGWADARECQRQIDRRLSTEIPAEVVVYPNTYHCFDCPGTNRKKLGYRMKYNKAAHWDSIKRVKAFLEAVFKPTE